MYELERWRKFQHKLNILVWCKNYFSTVYPHRHCKFNELDKSGMCASFYCSCCCCNVVCNFFLSLSMYAILMTWLKLSPYFTKRTKRIFHTHTYTYITMPTSAYFIFNIHSVSLRVFATTLVWKIKYFMGIKNICNWIYTKLKILSGFSNF